MVIQIIAFSCSQEFELTADHLDQRDTIIG